MSAASARSHDTFPLLIVTDVGARLVRRGLLADADGASVYWARARVLVFRYGPVLCDMEPTPALTHPPGRPTFQPRR